MKSPAELFINAVDIANRLKWSNIIIAIDFHGVLVNSVQFNEALKNGASIEQAVKESFETTAIAALQRMSIRKDIKLFLYTSTKQQTRELIGDAMLELYGVEFDYLNSANLNLASTRPMQDFNEKPYCDVLWDNTAGFEIKDWKDVGDVINDNYITPKKHGDS